MIDWSTNNTSKSFLERFWGPHTRVMGTSYLIQMFHSAKTVFREAESSFSTISNTITIFCVTLHVQLNIYSETTESRGGTGYGTSWASFSGISRDPFSCFCRALYYCRMPRDKPLSRGITKITKKSDQRSIILIFSLIKKIIDHFIMKWSRSWSCNILLRPLHGYIS